MKTQRNPVLCVLAGIILTGLPIFGAPAEAKPPVSARADVVFDHPEKFTDIKDSSMDTDKGRESIMAELRDFIVERASKYLPQGSKLLMTFTEVDLAGDYEPWRVGTNADVRVVKDIYPPRFEFAYKITDASGAVVKEGKQTLRDLSFMSRLVINRSDTLRFEKDMLNDWLRDNLRPAHK